MTANRSTSALLVGLALVAAAFLALQPKASKPASSTDKQRESPKMLLVQPQPDAKGTQAGPLTPIYDFLGLAVPGPPKGAVAEQGRAAARDRPYEWPSERHLEGYRFRFLIASVPDPIDSGFAYMFDQVVEAMQRALDVDDLVIDRAWLPWQRERVPGKPASRLQDEHPGLILFRSTPRTDGAGRNNLFALLLVGETPTAGVAKTAFTNAVRLIRDCPAAVKEEGNRLRVIAPYFSGSSVSLRLALEQARKEMESAEQGRARTPEPLVKVVCGSARGFDHSLFRTGWATSGKERAFETTILPDELVLEHVWRYLEEQAKLTRASTRELPNPIFVLQEANTGFGQYTDRKAREGTSRFTMYRIPFPFHISQLRAAYTREQLARLESQGLPRTGRNLPFPSVDGKETQRGALRAQGPLLTAATNELVLDNIVTLMAQKRVRRVFLVSTDPQDAIFLARVIRDRHPDVQLVTLGHDLLYTHEDYNYALHGMIVAGTYPLYPAFQRWSDLTLKPSPSRILFSHQSFQGCYNAVLVHLAGAASAAGRTGRKSAILESMLDYGWEPVRDTDGNRFTLPPIWLSVVSSNGQLIPLAHVSPNDYLPDASAGRPDPLPFVFCRPWPAELETVETDFGEVTFPGMWFVVFLLCLAVNVYFFYHAARYVWGSSWDATAGQLCCLYKQRSDFGVVCLAQILLFGRSAVLAWTPLQFPVREYSLHDVGAMAIVALSCGMIAASYVVYLLVQGRQPGGWDLVQRRQQFRDMAEGSECIGGCSARLGWLAKSGFWVAVWDLVIFALVTLTLVCFVWRVGEAAWAWLFRTARPGEVIDFERSIQLSNGVTPILPRVLFCAALFGWGYCLVKKLFLANRCDVACPFPNGGPRAFDGLRDLDRQVRSELMPPSTLRNHFWPCVGLFVFAAIVYVNFVVDAIPPLDGWWFGQLSLFGFSLGGLLLLFTLLQFHFAWRSLRKLLRFLALLPMQSSFQRLSDKVVSLFGGYLHSLRPRHSHLSVSVQQFQRMQQLFPAFHAALAQAARMHASVGDLSPEAVGAAWAEVQLAFPGGQFGPVISSDFDRELQPSREENLEPPATAVAPPSHEWGAETGWDCSELARRCLGVLVRFWPVHPMEEAFGHTPADGQAAEPLYQALPQGNPIREWAIAAEDFCAIEITRYLSQFVVQLRTLLTSLTVGSLLLLLAATVYPFFPQYQVLLVLTIVAGFMVAAIVMFLVQLNRDEVISRINRSAPNRFTPDLAFVQGAATYVLPIVIAFMVQFPVVTSSLRSLLAPLFHILR
jgi:hypothetical protein